MKTKVQALFFITYLCFLQLVILTISKHGAILIASSNSYYNYRHQANVASMYQVLNKRGINQKNIITVFYDDIANNPENPKPGTIVMKPGGENMYLGLSKDYIGQQVVPHNVLKLLRGDNMTGIGSEKHITTLDQLVIYITGPTQPHTLFFWNKEILHAEDLLGAIIDLYDSGRVKEILIIMEASFSGSFFDGAIPQDKKIFAITAASPHQGSGSCDFYEQYSSTFLSSCFSKHINNFLITEITNSTIIKDLLIQVKNETKTSSVCTYGDHSTTEKKTSEYFGIIESKNGGDDDDDDDDAAKITQQELSAEICYQKYKPSNNCMKKIISAYINAHGNFAEHNKYYIEKFIRNLCIDSAKKNVN